MMVVLCRPQGEVVATTEAEEVVAKGAAARGEGAVAPGSRGGGA